MNRQGRPTGGPPGGVGDGIRPRLSVLGDHESMSTTATEAIWRAIEQAGAARGVAHVALSGGTTPVRTYELLAARLAGRPSEAGARSCEPGPPVGSLELWFADERCVGPDDEESNFRLVRETLSEPAGLPAAQVHRMAGELGPEEGARRYGELLRARVDGASGTAGLAAPPAPLPVLDVVVLGIGPDGHIASLFPESDALLAGEEALCLGVHDSPKPPPERITLSLAVLRNARCCVLIASGPEKATALRAALGAPSPSAPASMLVPATLHVIADEPAAAELDRRPDGAP